MTNKEKATQAVATCLASLDPKKPLKFDRDKLAQAQADAREGLKIALELLERVSA